MWDVVGHEQAVERLRRSLRAGHIAHAYLITGPARVGKTTLGLRLAQALNCAAADPPCGECASCRRIAAGLHPDVRVLSLETAGEGEEGEERGRPRTGEKLIGIGQVRALQHEAALYPHEGRYRVFLILDAENLSPEAGNSLLKTLEEPPPRVVLLLTATDANMLLPTIVSRCQPLRLQPVAAAAIAAHLQARGIAKERAELVARLSGGRVGWAIAAVTDEEPLAERAAVLARLVPLIGAGPTQRMATAAQLANEFGRHRASVFLALDLWLTWWRDILLMQAGAAELLVNGDRLDELRTHAAGRDGAATGAYLARIVAARLQLEQNVNPRLALEGLLLSIPPAVGLS